MRTYTSRYIRTAAHRKRRLTLAHVAAQRKAREVALDIKVVTMRDMLDAWHIEGFGGPPVGVGGVTPCVYAKRWARHDAHMREVLRTLGEGA